MCAHIFTDFERTRARCVCQDQTLGWARGFTCVYLCMCVCMGVTNGWGPLVELEGLFWVKRMTEKKIRPRKEMERDRRAATSSKCNYTAQNR